MVMSGSQRSKEGDVQKISTSVFVTNFPDGYGAKDLWNTCKLYGHVVDVFIPDRRTKAGKRFGFVRFIKVRVVKALHGEDGKIGKKVQPRYPSTWLNIINEIESLKLHGIDLVSFITPKLGNGVNTSFWDVAWCGDIAFKNLVPRLYALESTKNIEVASKLSHG
nr:RNA-directed DNA polymerase, eukaryota, reverse transcriptase zinc-binding domain protein [Tanacetum cinerariifolium]